MSSQPSEVKEVCMYTKGGNQKMPSIEKGTRGEKGTGTKKRRRRQNASGGSRGKRGFSRRMEMEEGGKRKVKDLQLIW